MLESDVPQLRLPVTVRVTPASHLIPHRLQLRVLLVEPSRPSPRCLESCQVFFVVGLCSLQVLLATEEGVLCYLSACFEAPKRVCVPTAGVSPLEAYPEVDVSRVEMPKG